MAEGALTSSSVTASIAKEMEAMPSCGPKNSNSMFSLACAASNHSELASSIYGSYASPGGSQTFRQCSLQRGSTLNASQAPRNLLQQQRLRGEKPAPPKRMGSLPRSVTLHDLETPSARRETGKTHPVGSLRDGNVFGEVTEWLKVHAWKACVGETLPRVRIPLSPPIFDPTRK